MRPEAYTRSWEWKRIKTLEARIEALEAALREIEGTTTDPVSKHIARAALDRKSRDKPPRPDPSVPFAR